ncbi:MAG: hypothetical protein HY543_12040, partial [Deltaproteobacteria bacterium]|nr:hypothetical protein [Deltaproteobacteria bacterium]
DQCETVLMNLIRGCHLDGLRGMLPSRPLADGIRLVRPLLGIPRAGLAVYARAERLPVRTDATNAGLRYQRNRIRHRLIPLLRRLNPQAVPHVHATAARLAEEGLLLDAMTRVAARACAMRDDPAGLDAARLARLPAALARRVLRQTYIAARGHAAALGDDHLRHMEAIVRGRGREYALPDRIRLVREGDRVRFAANTADSRRRRRRTAA